MVTLPFTERKETFGVPINFQVMLLALFRISSLNGHPTGDSFVEAAHCLRLRLIAVLIAWLTPVGAALCDCVAFADGVVVATASVAVALAVGEGSADGVISEALGEGDADGVSTGAMTVGEGVATTVSEENLS